MQAKNISSVTPTATLPCTGFNVTAGLSCTVQMMWCSSCQITQLTAAERLSWTAWRHTPSIALQPRRASWNTLEEVVDTQPNTGPWVYSVDRSPRIRFTAPGRAGPKIHHESDRPTVRTVVFSSANNTESHTDDRWLASPCLSLDFSRTCKRTKRVDLFNQTLKMSQKKNQQCWPKIDQNNQQQNHKHQLNSIQSIPTWSVF